MASILIINEDGMLRGKHRKILEKHGHTVSEISRVEDRAYLPHDLVFTSIITQLCHLPDDSGLDLFPHYQELDHANHPPHR